MALISLFILEGRKVRYNNDWLVSVVDSEKDNEVAVRQWCRLRRVSLSAKGWVSW